MRPLFFKVVGLEARKLMSYRVDFWINAVAAFAAQLAVAYFLWLAVFEVSGSARIGGLTLAGMVLYYVLAILLGKMVRGQERSIGVALDIYEGHLTRYLIYPVDYFRFKYAEQVGALVPAVVQLALFGSLAMVFLELPEGLAITPGTVGRAAVAVALGNFLHFLITFPIQSIAFWADNVWSLNVMFRFTAEILGGLMLPLSVFPEWARQILELLPFQYLFYFPVMTLLGRIDPTAWARGLAIGLAWCLVIGWVGQWVWERGTRTYTGVGI
jgi:ABC-2 type transport system permease protein